MCITHLCCPSICARLCFSLYAAVTACLHKLQEKGRKQSTMLELDMELPVVYLDSGHIYAQRHSLFCLLFTAAVRTELCVMGLFMLCDVHVLLKKRPNACCVYFTAMCILRRGKNYTIFKFDFLSTRSDSHNEM